MLRVKLQLLFDSVLHQQTDVAVRHWEAVTHIHLFFGLLCCSRTGDVAVLVWVRCKRDRNPTSAFLLSFEAVNARATSSASSWLAAVTTVQPLLQSRQQTVWMMMFYNLKPQVKMETNQVFLTQRTKL